MGTQKLGKVHLGRAGQLILEEYFLRKNEKGEVVETPEQLFLRVARTLALADGKYLHKSFVEKLLKRYGKTDADFWWIADKTKEYANHVKSDKAIKQAEDEFYDLLASLDFLPNAITLFNAGRSSQLVACHGIALGDDTDAIFAGLHKAALIQQAGGSSAFDFSVLRPAGDPVGVNGKSSGPLSFMSIFDKATEQMRKGGKRRGLVSAVLRAEHPDSRAFIPAKYGLGLSTLRLFLALSDKFVQAVQKNGTIPLVNPRSGKMVGKVNAQELFTLAAETAWRTGSPGVWFVDELNRRNPLLRPYAYTAVSPGGEVGLAGNDSCPLGSINLAHMVKDGAVDWERLKKRLGQAVHFFDNLIDMTDYRDPEFFMSAHSSRRIGLGVMGFADMLLQLKVRYHSDKALKIADEVMKFVHEQAQAASVELAKKRGVFPTFKKSAHSSKKGMRLRNATLTSVAPTAHLGVIAGCSQGIEPLQTVVPVRTVEGKLVADANRYFVKATQDEGVYSAELLEKIKQQGNLKGAFIPVWIKKVFVTAREIPAEWHIKMQAAFQNHCDNGVAKKIYVPHESTIDDVKQAIMFAYSLKCTTVVIERSPVEGVV